MPQRAKPDHEVVAFADWRFRGPLQHVRHANASRRR